MFWSKLNNVRIHQLVITQLLFPELYQTFSEIDPLGKLKTTKKRAEMLMDLKVITLISENLEK